MANTEINDITLKATPVSSDEMELQETAGGLSKKATIGSAVNALETSHTDVMVDGDFASEGYMKRGVSAGTYSIQATPIPTTETAAKCTDATADNTSANETSHAGLITSTGVTFENLNGNSDVGTGAAQVAQGDHAHDSDYISIVTTPTTGNFPQLTAGGELVNSTYDETSFSLSGHDHVEFLTEGEVDARVSATETSHTDVVQDGDFATNGYMKRTAAGVYGVQSSPIPVTETDAKCTDATADNTASNETTHTDVVQDGDFTANGFMKRTAAGVYTVDTGTYTPTTSHDGDGTDAVVLHATTGTIADANGISSVAIGEGALAHETTNISIGNTSVAGQTPAGTAEFGAIAIGDAATAHNAGGIAIGYTADAGESGTSTLDDAVAIGTGSAAVGADTVAVGHWSLAGDGNTNEGVAVGFNAYCYAYRGVSLGSNTWAYEDNCIAIGYGSEAGKTEGASTEVDAIAIGNLAKAYETSTVAIGDGAKAGQSATSLTPDGLAIGTNALADRGRAISIGASTDARAASTLAIGDASQALEESCIAVGHDATAGQTINGSTELGAIAVGSGAKAYETSSIAVGVGAIAGAAVTSTDPDSIAIGRAALADQDSSLSIGVISDARGTGAVAVGANAQALEAGGVSIGWGSQSGQIAGGGDEHDSIAVGYNAKAYETDGIAIGNIAVSGKSGTSADPACIAIGYGADAYNEYSIAIGRTADAGGFHGVSMGPTALAHESYCVAIGDAAQAGQTAEAAAETNAIAVGSDAKAYGYSTIAIGNGAEAGATGQAGRDECIAIGQYAVASANGAMTIGYNLDNATADSIMIGTNGLAAIQMNAAHEHEIQQTFNATTLTDATSIAWAVSTNQVTKVTLGGNRTMAAPTVMKDGGFYSIRVAQDATGSRTLAWNAVFKWENGAAPTLSTAASAVDLFVFESDGTNMLERGRRTNVS